MGSLPDHDRDPTITASTDQAVLNPDELLDWLDMFGEEISVNHGIALSRLEWEIIAAAWDASIESKKIAPDRLSGFELDLEEELNQYFEGQ